MRGRIRRTAIGENMFRFWINIDQKVLSAKIYLKEMIHTDFVVEIRDDRNQQYVNRGNFFEEFSICPVHTGMNLWQSYGIFEENDLPRIHGDAP